MKNIIFIFFLFCNLIAYTKTFYVSSNDGNDNNDGSFDLPFKSIQKAINNLEAGDTCIVLEGIYYENLSFPKSGSDDLPILLKNFPNHRVVIKNVSTKKDWIKHEKNIYKTKINNNILQVFFDELPEMQASFPTIREGQLTKNSWLNAFANTNKTITLSQNFNKSPNENVQFCGIFGNGLIAIGGKVIEKNNNSISIENESWYWGDAYKIDYLGSGKCFLTGSYQFLDSPGEWYCDSNYFYTIPKNNDTLNLSKLELREQFYVLNLKDQKNITIEGIHFFGGSLNLNNVERCTVNNCTIEYIRPFFNFTYGYTANMDSTKIGHGILITGKNNSIINTTISNSWGDGLTINGDNITIENCLINNCDWMGIDCAPIYISGSQNTIKNNTIKNSGRSLIVHGVKNSKIINNHLSNFGWLNSDLGGIYCYGVDGQNTEIAYNFVTKSKAKNGVGIYIDNGCKNYTVHHNIVSSCNVGITLNKPGTNYKIYHNTLYKNNFSMGSWGTTGNNLNNVYTFNNLTDNDNSLKWNYKSYYGTQLDSNFIYTSSIFADAPNGDFHLKPKSYPIDKGMVTPETNNFNGRLPDLGAYETGEEFPVIGSSLKEENTKNGIPLPPLNFKIKNFELNKVKFSWEYPYMYNEKFIIKRKLSNDKFIEIGRTNSDTFEYIDTIKETGEYRYQLYAQNINGTSEESNSLELFYDNPINNVFLNAENCDLQKGIMVDKDLINYIDNRDWICFHQINFKNFNRCKIRYGVPCDFAGQEVQLRLNKPMGKIIGKFNTRSTGSFDSLKIFENEIDTINGIHDVYIRYRGTYGIGNFDWFELFNSNDSNHVNYNDTKCIDPEGMQNFYSSIVFPNPTFQTVTLSYYYYSNTSIEVNIYDQYGLHLYKNDAFNLSKGTNELQINEFEKYTQGLYYIKSKIYTKDKIIEEKTHKVIKI